jgi:L-fuconolactonase
LERFCSHPTGKLKGVRHVIHDEPEEDFMLLPEFRRGIAALSSYKLAYDLLLFPKHLPNALKLVTEFPNQAFVLDHLGNPPIVAGATEPPKQWLNDLNALAACPNVFCKISGMVTKWEGEGEWRGEDFHPVIAAALQAFTPSRCVSALLCVICAFFFWVCAYLSTSQDLLLRQPLPPFSLPFPLQMIGSDYPVSLLASKDYASAQSIVVDYCKRNLSAEEAAGVLGGNAKRFYRL